MWPSCLVCDQHNENDLKLKLLKSKGGNIGFQTILYGIVPKLCHQEGKIIAAVGDEIIVTQQPSKSTPHHKNRFKQYGSPQYLDGIFQFYIIAHNIITSSNHHEEIQFMFLKKENTIILL